MIIIIEPYPHQLPYRGSASTSVPHSRLAAAPWLSPRAAAPVLACDGLRRRSQFASLSPNGPPASGTRECHLNCSINCLYAEKQYLKAGSGEDATPAAAIMRQSRGQLALSAM